MKKLKSEKGITMVALAVTIIVLSLISVPIVINTSRIKEFDNYKSLKDDIDTLRESISTAFFDEDISKIGPIYSGPFDFMSKQQNGENVKNVNDNEVYYAININRVNERLSVNMRELNYGTENSNIGDSSNYFGTNDVYIINEASRTIYYVQGVSYNGSTYYRLAEELTSTSEGIKPGEFVTDINKIYKDKDGAIAKIPVDFKVSEVATEQTISTGLVIKDKSGNEFVWIPVQEFQDSSGATINVQYDRVRFDTQYNGGIDNASNSYKIYNSRVDSYYFYEASNNIDAKSVLENKGFYIGRYEAGSNESRNVSSTNNAPLIQKGKNVYNFITKTDANNLSNSFVTSNYVTSKLCSGYTWDTTLQFLQKTGNGTYLIDVSAGNHTSALNTTGATTAVNNIYDLAGNVYEWTTENSSNPTSACTIRGGGISKSDAVTSRTAKNDEKSNDTGFRIVLYVK